MNLTVPHKVAKIVKRVIVAMLLLPIIVIALFYIPAVQNIAKDLVLKQINQTSGIKIEADRLQISFPLDIEVYGARIIEETSDTMVDANFITADVALLPLLRGEIKASTAEVLNANYSMGNIDSTLHISIKNANAKVHNALLKLSSGEIEIGKSVLSNAEVTLSMRNDTTATSTDTTTSAPWKIAVHDITLKDITYQMSMAGVADSIGAYIGEAQLTDGFVDTGASSPNISAAQLSVTGSNATYNIDSKIPVKDGLDLNYLKAEEIVLLVDSFSNSGAKLRVPIKQISAAERCGLAISAKGLFEMDSTSMKFDGIDLTTMFSRITLSGELGLTGNDSPIRINANANIGLKDIETAYPDLQSIIRQIAPDSDLEIMADIDGNLSSFDLHRFSIELPQHLEFAMEGKMENSTDINRISGNLDISGNISDVDFVKPSVMDTSITGKVNIPPMSLQGNIAMHNGIIDGILQAITETGRLALDAVWNSRGEEYELSLDTDSFPANAFLPELGFGVFSADIKASGKGYDLMSPTTEMNFHTILHEMLYHGKSYKNAQLWASLKESNAEMGIVSLNDNADFDLTANASISGKDTIAWELNGDIRNIDLRSLKLSETQSRGLLSINGNGTINISEQMYQADLNINDLEWDMPGLHINTPTLNTSAEINNSLVKASLTNNDLKADFIATCSLDTLINRITQTINELDNQITHRSIDVSQLQHKLPRFALSLNAGNDNILNSILASSNMSVNDIAIETENDSLFNINGTIRQLKLGDTRLDTINISALQHSKFLIYKATIDNRRGTYDKFAHVSANGYLADDKLALFIKQRDINERVGFNFGTLAAISDSSITLRFTPSSPIIGYKNWNINSDNYINLNYITRHLDANLHMNSQDSKLNLFTEHDHQHNSTQEDVILNISDIRLSELLSVSPYAPPIKGNLSADMRFRWDKATLSGEGLVNLSEIYFGRDRVGTFDLGVDVTTNKSGTIQANASLMVDNVKTITVAGSLNDSTSTNPFNLDFRMIHFPLQVLNPFLPKETASIYGTLNGEMDVTGELSSPLFNGYINFDSTAVKVSMLGSSFAFADERIPIKNNTVTFTDYEITGANKNPLTINGIVNMGNFISPQIDLTFNASNMQFINSSRGKNTDIYGKGFINLDASVAGNTSMLDIDATLSLLGGSNITYVMPDATSTITSQSTGNMVKFVNLTDDKEIARHDSIETSSMSMNIDALIRISSGTTINVDLSTDGKNRVQLQGSGTLNYTMNDMDDNRFTGRYTLDKGFVRYTPPLMSEKLFNFKEGSYVAFNGDILNPILNIHATDDIRANVSRENQDSRLVNFNVDLSVTNTLNNMNVEFDLSTPDDITIQNELQIMSAEQRANQAMNLLLYNVYTGPGSTANANMSGNPLYSFLESQINTWAANNIKFVDISFGIDQYDKTLDGATSSTMNYSYRVSKTLFNDRFKIVVGGNYSTDTESDEDAAQSLINDISFEYMLNRSGSMYVKVFRHVGYESILEGEVTQTGVGFVYKRKLHSLRDLFKFKRQPNRSDAKVNDPQNKPVNE